jgi:hypothetical protein
MDKNSDIVLSLVSFPAVKPKSVEARGTGQIVFELSSADRVLSLILII